MQFTVQPVSIGFILAVIALIVVIVMALIGQLDYKLAAILALLCVARLL